MVEKYSTELKVIFGVGVVSLLIVFYIPLLYSVSSNYLPVWSDEFFYFVNSHAAFQNNTFQAAFTYSGSGSAFFGADAHGIGYPLIHSTLAKVFGWHPLNFIYFNFFLFFSALSLIWFLKSLSKNQRLLITSCLFLFPFFTLFAFTFMQEVLHLFFAIILSVIIYLIDTKKNNSSYLFCFICVIVIAGFFRSLWFFWLIGLIPFAKNKNQRVVFILIFLIGIVVSFLVNHLFTEPVPNYFSSITTLFFNGEYVSFMSSLLDHVWKNIREYFLTFNKSIVYFSMKVITFGLVMYFVFLAQIKKVKLHKSLALIGLVNFALLFFLYEAYDWREIRTMSPLYYFLILFFVIELPSKFQYALTGLLAIFFTLSLKISKQWIEVRNFPHQLTNKEQKAYELLAQKIPNKKTVLLHFPPNHEAWKLLFLPLKNDNNEPIRYIVPYYLINNISYDYILNNPRFLTNVEKIIDNEFYQLVKKE